MWPVIQVTYPQQMPGPFWKSPTVPDGFSLVHKILLSQNIALLEGIVLQEVPEGHYFLSAAPLNLAGSDGAPCRAYLTDSKTGAD